MFLICGLLFPRLTLLVCHLTGNMPANPTDYWTDVVGGILAPRLLIAYWATATGEHVMWTVLYCLVWLLAPFAAGGRSSGHPSSRERAS